MTASEFIAKWRPVQLRERQARQEHFLDLCELLGHPKPAEMDPVGERFCFERGIGTVRWPRLVPRDAECAARLKTQTLTILYNHHPAWLANAHAALDAAVLAAYGWDPSISDDELLERLLALNLQRATGAG